MCLSARNVAYRSINWWVYGKFVGVDFLEPNYQRALRAINSVRSGEVKRYISATRKTQELIAAVSPTFASIKDYFDKQSPKRDGAILRAGNIPRRAARLLPVGLYSHCAPPRQKRGIILRPRPRRGSSGKWLTRLPRLCSKGNLNAALNSSPRCRL